VADPCAHVGSGGVLRRQHLPSGAARAPIRRRRLGALPYFAPAFLATGNPVLASNLLFLGGVTLTVCAVHRLVAGWTGLESAASSRPGRSS